MDAVKPFLYLRGWHIHRVLDDGRCPRAALKKSTACPALPASRRAEAGTKPVPWLPVSAFRTHRKRRDVCATRDFPQGRVCTSGKVSQENVAARPRYALSF